jgi:chaperone modulatory protein CbpM
MTRMAQTRILALDVVVVDEETRLTLDELCRACGADTQSVVALVQEGVLEPAGRGIHDWTFSGPALKRTRTALRLLQDLDLSVSAAALVLDLLEEIESLRSRLRRAGVGSDADQAPPGSGGGRYVHDTPNSGH